MQGLLFIGMIIVPNVNQIGTSTGVISVKDQIDFETYPYLAFDATATDSGGLSSGAHVNITINDVNDFRPTFVREFFNLEVPDTIGVGTYIATLLALDNNAGYIIYNTLSPFS